MSTMWRFGLDAWHSILIDGSIFTAYSEEAHPCDVPLCFYLLFGKVNSVFNLLRYVPMLIVLFPGWHRISAAEERMDRRAHPYLFFDAEGLKRLRVRLEDEPMNSRWDVFLRNAERCLTVPVAEGGGQWDRKRARASLKICGLTALAYVVTGDVRFGDRAKAELFSVLSATRWMNPGNERFTRGADLATADGALITALVYDWCYDRFTDAERKQVQDGIQRLAFDYYRISIEKPDWWVKNPVSNWAGVCHGGPGLAGLTFYWEMETARAVADSAWVYTPKFLDSLTGADGAGHEGVMYFEYGAGYALRFVDAYAHVFGDDGGVFDRMAERLVGYWLVYMQGPDGRYANFNNMNEHTFNGLGLAGLGDPPNGGPSSTLLALLESHTPNGDRLLRWGADHGSASYIYWGPEPFYFLWRSERPVVAEKPELDDAVLFRTARHAVLQSPRLWMAYNGGWISDKSHSNFDLGSFVLVVNGERFVHDAGYGVTATEDHSTVLVHGFGQPKGASAKTLRFGSGDGFYYMLSDLSDAYEDEAELTRFHRHVLMVDGRYVVLLDDLACRGPGQFEWRLQTRQAIETDGLCAVLKGETGGLHVLSAVQNVTVSTGKGALDYVQISPVTETERQMFVTVLIPVEGTGGMPNATFEDGVLTVTIGERRDRIVFTHGERWVLQSVNGVDASHIGDGSERTLSVFRD